MKTINHIIAVFRLAVALGAIALGVSQAQAQYSWYSFQTSPGPPYAVPTNIWEQEIYQTGTVPVMLAPSNPLDFGALYALLNHKDSNGDFEVYGWFSDVSEWLPAYGGYLSGIVNDNYTPALWGITDNGEVWSTYPYGNNWTHYWNNYTSLAVQNPTAANPAGYLFATASNSTTNGSANGGPSGPTIELYNPTGEFPNGTWTNTGWGAYQVSADPVGSDVAALDSSGVVWSISPAYFQQPGGKRLFLGYRAAQLSYVQCRNSDAITFAQVAVKNGTYIGLDSFAGGSPQISNAVWYYTAKGCWQQVGSKANFLSIATDGGYELVWASDTSGKIWYAE